MVFIAFITGATFGSGNSTPGAKERFVFNFPEKMKKKSQSTMTLFKKGNFIKGEKYFLFKMNWTVFFYFFYFFSF